jgi:hypothetical protein
MQKKEFVAIFFLKVKRKINSENFFSYQHLTNISNMKKYN